MHPGPIDTEMLNVRTPEQNQQRLQLVPIKRMGTAEEVASLVLFLLSDESGYMTGAEGRNRRRRVTVAGKVEERPNAILSVRKGVFRSPGKAWFRLANRACAWSSPVEGATKRRLFAVLHTDRINSPLEAVRAAIVAERRTTR